MTKDTMEGIEQALDGDGVTASVRLDTPEAIRAACALYAALGENGAVTVMYDMDDEDGDLVGVSLEEFMDMQALSGDYEGYTAGEALQEFVSGRDDWQLCVTDNVGGDHE